MTTQNIPSSNPNSTIRTRFAYRFIRALKKLDKTRSNTSHPTTTEMSSRRIKMAADASMASAVGSRRLWSRALLWKIRNRTSRRRITIKINSRTKSLRRIKRRGNPKVSFDCELKKIVPGGESMNMWNLLDETAHYVKCLTTQVQVMRNIVELYSTTNQ